MKIYDTQLINMINQKTDASNVYQRIDAIIKIVHNIDKNIVETSNRIIDMERKINNILIKINNMK